MRALLTVTLLSSCILLVPLFVTLQEATAYSSGAPASFAGNYEDQPGVPRTCVVCHDSYEVNEGPGSVAIDVPGEVAPGDTVAVTVTLTGLQEDGRQGFELAVENAEGDPYVGEFDLAGSTDIQFTVGSEEERHEVTHTLEGTALHSWTVNWIAPEKLADNVTFYAAANATNYNEKPSGDYIYTTTVVLPVTIDAEDSPGAGTFALSPVWPNPVQSMARTTLTVRDPGVVTARLLDSRGRLVRVLAVEEMARGDHELNVDVQSLAAGSYVILVDAPGGVLHRTLTVL